jgi:uncharacterized membrane protein
MAATATQRRTRRASFPVAGRQPQTAINVGDSERLLSVLGGGALGVYGLSRGDLGGLALAALSGALIYRGATGHCNLYGALGINTSGRRGPATSVPAGHGIKVEESVTINRPVEDVYRFWRNLENLSRFMHHLDCVKDLGNNRSHWAARAPLGMTVEWDAEIINDKPNDLIAWRSLEGSEVETAGSVHFKGLSFGRGTEVRVSLKYNPPAGKAGATVARLFGRSPESEIREDLRNLKRILETGATPTVSGQPMGHCHT